MMTREEAVAQIALEVPALPPERTREILACADQDAIDGGTRVATLLRSYADDGVMPDETGWQVFSTILSQVPDVAAKIGPIVGLALSLLPLL
jgi:hypothetical protein